MPVAISISLHKNCLGTHNWLVTVIRECCILGANPQNQL